MAARSHAPTALVAAGVWRLRIAARSVPVLISANWVTILRGLADDANRRRLHLCHPP
jgi:hypothetical protein